MKTENNKDAYTLKSLIFKQFIKFEEIDYSFSEYHLDLKYDILETLNTYLATDLENNGNKHITEQVDNLIIWCKNVYHNPKAYKITPEGRILKDKVPMMISDRLHKGIRLLLKHAQILGYIK